MPSAANKPAGHARGITVSTTGRQPPEDLGPGLDPLLRRRDDNPVAGAAVLVVLLAIWVGKSAWKKPNSGARLAALLGLIIGLWFIFAVADPHGGGMVALDAAEGVKDLAVGLGHILATF